MSFIVKQTPRKKVLDRAHTGQTHVHGAEYMKVDCENKVGVADAHLWHHMWRNGNADERNGSKLLCMCCQLMEIVERSFRLRATHETNMNPGGCGYSSWSSAFD